MLFRVSLSCDVLLFIYFVIVEMEMGISFYSFLFYFGWYAIQNNSMFVTNVNWPQAMKVIFWFIA